MSAVCTALTASPDAVRQRFSYVEKALEIISEGTGLQVGTLDLTSAGELKVHFREFKALVTMSVPENDFSKLEKQCERLKVLINKLADKLTEVREIDLAFNKLGVVKFYKK